MNPLKRHIEQERKTNKKIDFPNFAQEIYLFHMAVYRWNQSERHNFSKIIILSINLIYFNIYILIYILILIYIIYI